MTWNELFRNRWVGSDHPAIVTSDGTWSGDELARCAGGAAAWLDALGFERGSFVPLLMDESADTIALAVGATLSGRIPAPLGTKMPAADLAVALRGLGARVVIAEERLADLASEAATLAGATVVVLGTLHGRTNDRIIRGGENIYPVEVEQALIGHPGVREVAVVGMPDRRWGEIVKAVIVAEHAAGPPPIAELQQYVRDRLAHFKVPAVVEFAVKLPRNASGKVVRRKLRSADSEPDPSASLEQTAVEFRTWLAANEAELSVHRAECLGDLSDALLADRPIMQRLWDAGWMRLGWPVEVGGRGGSSAHRAIVMDALATAGYAVPAFYGPVEIIAPMLIRYAPRLAAAHVAAGARGDEVWCQGFSEPDAGSDLGSLRTRAVQVDGGYAITGQKMWSSNGHVSQWCCLLARTAEQGSGYRGLTMFWVDMNASGISVVPTRCESGRAETAEIFFDEVFVPASHLIGPVGEGWSAVMYLLQFERGAYAWERQADLHGQLQGLVAHPTLPANAAHARW